jgi:DNA-binding beta-propeller fold protein YncE
MALLTSVRSFVVAHLKQIALAAAAIPAWLLYVAGLTKNPPGLYMDESIFSYNAWLVYSQHTDEYGHSWPLFLPAFELPAPYNFVSYMDPVQIYVMAFTFCFLHPSIAVARGVSATSMFVACILLGILAKRISGRTLVGVLIAIMGLLTPWLYELGRIAFGAGLYPLAITIFLFVLFVVSRKPRWNVWNYIAIAIALALCTYTYAPGRLLGPLLALCLLLFATSRRGIKDVFFTWVAYGLTLIPMLVFHLRNPGALAGRFNMLVGVVKPEYGLQHNLKTFWEHYQINTSLYSLLYTGDPIFRHHITDTPFFLAPVFILSVVGLVVILVRHNTDHFWRYVVVGTLVVPIPSSLTLEPFHMLRLSAVPVFLLVMAIPGLSWFVEYVQPAGSGLAGKLRILAPRYLRIAGLVILLILTVVQAISFQREFWARGPYRDRWFDEAYPRVMAAALAQPQRPIYLYGQSYIHAFWQSAVQDIDIANFHKVGMGERPPAGAIVLSQEDTCTDCEVITSEAGYILYKQGGAASPSGSQGPMLRGDFAKARGIAAGPGDDIFIADTEHARIQRFSSNGQFSGYINPDKSAGGIQKPIGIAVDKSGSIYASDISVDRVYKIAAGGNIVKDWAGPEPGFYGLRDIAISGPQLYVLDQGRNRVVKINVNTNAMQQWGRAGVGEGEFTELTGIDVAGDRVYIADARNDRIQVFDLNGKFLKQWPVPQWERYIWHFPDVAADQETGRVYVTSGWSNEVLVFDQNGTLIESIKAGPTVTLDNPSSIILVKNDTGKHLYVLNTGKVFAEQPQSSVSIIDLPVAKANERSDSK